MSLPFLPATASTIAASLTGAVTISLPRGATISPALASLLQDELPAPLWAAAVATWTGNSGDVNEVVHLSAYSNALPVADMLQVTAWRDFLKQHGALVEDIQSSLMTPVHFSPWH